MKPTSFITIALLILSLASMVGNALAVTLSASRTTAYPGEPITFTATVTINGMAGTPPSARLVFNFDDGATSPTIFINAVNGTSESHSRSHSFAAPGTYRVRAISTAEPGYTVVPPTTAAVTITILPNLNAPPAGTVAEPYDHDLAGTAEARRNIYNVIGGRMAPGLELQRNGTITGTPTQKGVFTFTVRITGPDGGTLNENFSITIRPGNLRIATSPATISITRDAPGRQQITFSVIQPRFPLPETIVSTRGEFYINGRLAATNPTPLSIDLNNNRPLATESITIPANVIRAAQDSRTGAIQYRRSFSSANLNSGSGETNMELQTAAAGDLRIQKMRIYFEQNNRPIIVVQRQDRDLRGKVDIHYSGSGTFKGFWRVDDRIIQRVQKNLYYGKVLTLATPDTPYLPTYSEGAHRLQFIITEPETASQTIDFPTAIYHVEAKRAEIIDALTLITPAAQATITNHGELFTWSHSPRVSTYQLDFFEAQEQEPFFKAFTRENQYNLSETVLDLKFVQGSQYRWKVKGINEEGDLVAESGERFVELEKRLAYVPGEIIFVVKMDDTGRRLITEMIDKYNLELVEQTELLSANRILVLCRTEESVLDITARMKLEHGLSIAQPNFIFSTMTGKDPLRSFQTMNTFLDLDHLHSHATGKNIVVAVIDTGVDLHHGDIRPQIQEHHNFISSSPYVGEIHGTAVAGIIAGAENNIGIIGIAPQAKLLALRACHQLSPEKPEGECFSSSIARAIDAAILGKADIANLSFGSFAEDELMDLLLHQGRLQGVIFIAPVGNQPQAENITFPASHQDVTAVAGFDDTYQPLPNRKIAQMADAVAPGSDFFSTAPAGKHNFFSGTSFSSAAISGITALSMEKNNGRPSTAYPRFADMESWKDKVETYLGIKQ